MGILDLWAVFSNKLFLPITFWWSLSICLSSSTFDSFKSLLQDFPVYIYVHIYIHTRASGAMAVGAFAGFIFYRDLRSLPSMRHFCCNLLKMKQPGKNCNNQMVFRYCFYSLFPDTGWVSGPAGTGWGAETFAFGGVVVPGFGAHFYCRKLCLLGRWAEMREGWWGWIWSRLSAGSWEPFLEQEVSEPLHAGDPGRRMLGVRLLGVHPPPASTHSAFWYLQWKTPYKPHVLLFIITVLFSPSQTWLHCSIFPFAEEFPLFESYYPKQQRAAVNPRFLSSGICKCTAACAKACLHVELRVWRPFLWPLLSAVS